ncbi:MAG: recombinase family protein [Phycisphaeraceae bacterium]|nr:recombinase family protein [Phycisphaeraceae bacterium]
MSSPLIRCAVYTRKSSEEGLDQAFNSLDAQREAGLDYIKSQKHQGWIPVATAYDDGGYSGGSMDRPALQQLLADIRQGKIDVVVVYKVDRLSRSLADFARLMQLFDEHRVSFVSVTQQFNTTTSMGRLTLNMLLSFAQFEREVTGERIRDKIAATKRQGVWVCGQPPLGYRLPTAEERQADRRLHVVDAEAAVVRAIFDAYLQQRSLLDVAQRMNQAGYTTRRWLSSRGIWHGGRRFSANHIYRVLTNPTYVGMVMHTRGGKTEVFPGLHEPVISQTTWDQVQAAMKTIERNVPTRWTHTHLLKGKVRTFEDFAMSPGSVSRKTVRAGGHTAQRRVFYYCSQKALKRGYKHCSIKSINAQHLDDLVRAVVLEHLVTNHQASLHHLDAASRDHWIRQVLHQVVLAPDRLTAEINPDQVEACKQAAATAVRNSQGTQTAIPQCLFTPEVQEREGRIVLTLHIQLKRHDNRRIAVAPDGRDLFLTYTSEGKAVPQPHLVRAIGQAFHWRQQILKRNVTIAAVAKHAQVTPRRVAYLLHLTRLGPKVVRAILTGQLGPSITLKDLHAAANHLDWSVQAAALMLDPQAAAPAA